MATHTPDGGPAFPANFSEHVALDAGMSLLDYFAGQYIAGRAAREDGVVDFDDVAVAAYVMAQALLRARGEAR